MTEHEKAISDIDKVLESLIRKRREMIAEHARMGPSTNKDGSADWERMQRWIDTLKRIRDEEERDQPLDISGMIG